MLFACSFIKVIFSPSVNNKDGKDIEKQYLPPRKEIGLVQ
jgi:hypothetical protein